MSSAFKQGATLLTGSIAAQIFPALAAPLITRVYDPSAFGAFAVVLAAFGVLAPIACLRYDLAIVLPDRNEDAAPIAGLCLVIAAAWAFVLALPLFLAEHYFQQPRYREFAMLLLAMVPLSLFMQGCQVVAQSWCLRIQNFRVISLAAASQALITVVCQLLFGKFIAASAFALIAGALIGNSVAVLILLPVLTRTVLPAVFGHATPVRVAAAARDYGRFPLVTGPYAFVCQALARCALIVLGYWLGASIVGQYALAQRVTLLPVVTVAAAMSQVFYSRAARRIDEPRTEHVVRTLLNVGPWVIGPLFMLLMLFGTQIFTLIFGAGWGEAGRLAGILAAASLVRSLTSWLDRIFDIRAKQHLALAVTAAFTILAIVAMSLVLRETRSGDAAVLAYVIVTAVCYFVWITLALRIARFSRRISAEFLGSTLLMAAVVMGFYEALVRLHAPLVGQFAGSALLSVIIAVIALRHATARLTGSW